ncbi:hypothetical protein Dimus_029315 [Dionaea muscipula]
MEIELDRWRELGLHHRWRWSLRTAEIRRTSRPNLNRESSTGKNPAKHPLASSGPLLLGCRRRPPPPEAHKAGEHPATASGPRGGDDGQGRVNRAETIFGEIQGFSGSIQPAVGEVVAGRLPLDASEAAYVRSRIVLGGCWCFDGGCGVLVVAGCFWGCRSWVEAAAVGGTSDGAGQPVGTVGASLVSDSSGWWLPEGSTTLS